MSSPPGVYRAVAEPESVNLGLVVGRTGALLVDTGSSPGPGRGAYAPRSQYGDRSSAGGGRGHPLALRPRVRAGRLRRPGRPSGTSPYAVGSASPEAAAEAARLGLIDRGPGAARPGDRGGDRRRPRRTGGWRSPTSAAGTPTATWSSWCPDADVIFAGDLIESAGPPSFGPDSVLAEWAGTLDGLIGLMTATTRGRARPRRPGGPGVRLRAARPDRRPGGRRRPRRHCPSSRRCRWPEAQSTAGPARWSPGTAARGSPTPTRGTGKRPSISGDHASGAPYAHRPSTSEAHDRSRNRRWRSVRTVNWALSGPGRTGRRSPPAGRGRGHRA